jgi:transcription elongation GreA/GreB family factor
VAKVAADKAMITLGQDRVTAGQTVKAISKGEEIIDPETGESLGSEEEEIGLLEVTDVKEKYSYAVPVGFELSALKVGDKVVATEKPAPLQFASSWKAPGK